MNRSSSDQNGLRVGELARRSGLTVRTLHHWDQIGLLQPKGRTRSGHRLYGSREVERLQRIVSLRALGLGLEDIKGLMEGEGSLLESVLRAHRDEVRKKRGLLEELEERLDWVLDYLERNGGVPEEELLKTMEIMAMMEDHYTPEQLEALKKREEELGPEAIKEAQEEWPRLIAAVKEEMEKGTDPASEKVQALAQRWSCLIEAFTGGDPGIKESLGNMYRGEPQMATQQGMDPALFKYIGEAMGKLG